MLLFLWLTAWDETALRAYVEEAREAKTHALVVLRDGKVAVERYFDHKAEAPIKVRSITKVLAALAIGLLIEDGKIASLDEPVARWIPEWAADGRKAITLRHILSHTSGLEPRFGDAEMTGADSREVLAQMRLADPPGTLYTYSNQGMQVPSLVVEAEAKQTLEAFVKKRIFSPLGITHAPWSSDRGGHTYAYAGLELSAMDVAKIGQLLCDGGRQIVPRTWIDAASRPSVPFSQVYGLGLELFPEVGSGRFTLSPLVERRLSDAGFSALETLQPLRARSFATLQELSFEAAALLKEPERRELAALLQRGLLRDVRPDSDVRAFGHSGSFGQLLLCVPGTPSTVVVRLLRAPGGPFNASAKVASWLTEPAQVTAAGDGAETILYLGDDASFVSRAAAAGYAVVFVRRAKKDLGWLVEAQKRLGDKPVHLVGNTPAAAALVSAGKVPLLSFVAAHTGGSIDVKSARPVRTLLLTAKADDAERPNVWQLSAELSRAGWQHTIEQGAGTSAFSAREIDRVLGFLAEK